MKNFLYFFSVLIMNVQMQGNDFFTKDGMPKTPFPNGWKGDNGLYTVGFTRRGLLGTTYDAGKIAQDIAEQWRPITIKDCKSTHVILLGKS